MTSIWTPEADAQLVRLWMQAKPRLSLTQIAVIMRLSKNQVVGRGHRLAAKGLVVPRGSPINIERAANERRQRQAVLLAALAASARRPDAGEAPRAAPPPVSSPLAPVSRARPSRGCQWIHGEAAGAQSRFCDAPAIGGSSYCAAHHARCHTTRPNWAA